MNRFISWSRNKIIGKKGNEGCVRRLDETDGGKKGSETNGQGSMEGNRGIGLESGKHERVLMIQWKEEDSPCLSQLSDDSAFSSSGCIVHSSQLDSDSARGDHNFNCSLDDHDDTSDEDLRQTNIQLSSNTDHMLKRDSDEKSFSSLSSHSKPLSIFDSQLLSVCTHQGNSSTSFEKHELLRSTSVEAENKKVRFRDRLRRISKLGFEKERNTICVDSSQKSPSLQSSPSFDMDGLDIWVSSSFCPKPDSLVEVVRVDPFMRARILSFSGVVTSSSSPSNVAILQNCSKNKDISFEKEFQKCLKKGQIKKAGKRIKYCFLFESFLLLTKQKFPSIFQLKHVVTLKMLWISVQPSGQDGGDDNDEGVGGSFDNDGVCMDFNQPAESNDDDNDGGGENDNGNDKRNGVDNDVKKEFGDASQNKDEIQMNVTGNIDDKNGNKYSQQVNEINKYSKNDSSSLYVKKVNNWQHFENTNIHKIGKKYNSNNNINITSYSINNSSNNINNSSNNINNNTSNNNNNTSNNSNTSSNNNNSLCVLIGWINQRIHMKRLCFQSELEKKAWIQAISRQQDLACSEVGKTLVVKVECYDKQLGTRTKKLEVSRNETMTDVLEKKGFSFRMFHSFSDFTYGVKFVNNAEKFYLNGSESLFVLQLASNSNLLNGNIDCFTIYQARVSSISKQINSRRRRIKRTCRLELSRDFLAYKQSKAPMNKCRLFGCNLQEFCVANDNKVPSVILSLLQLLYDESPRSEGIFRKSHNQRELKDKVSSFNSFRGQLDNVSVHMAGAILKYWLIKLEDCLLMSRFYFKWLEVGRIKEMDKQIEEYKKLSKRLPSCHWLVLRYLMCVLNRISTSAKTNLMSSRNLAVCLGPSLLKPSSLVDVSQEINSVDAANDVVEVLISRAEEIFGRVERSEMSSEEMCDDVWKREKENMTSKNDLEIMKFQSCENLDCGMQEEEKEESRQRANSFHTKPSHPPLINTITPASSHDHSSQDMSKEFDLEICQIFREPKDKLYSYTDTTNTDDSFSEGSFYQKPIMSLVKDAIFNNFVKNIHVENVNLQCDQKEEAEEKDTGINENDVKFEDPKTPTKNSCFSKGKKKTDSREASKEAAAKDGSVSSDSDTLTKGSCMVSNVNSPAMTTSKTTFEYPVNKLIIKSTSKSTSKIEKTFSESQKHNHFIKLSQINKGNYNFTPRKKSHSFSSSAFNKIPSLPKSLGNTDNKLSIENHKYSSRSSSSFSLKSPEHQAFRKLPQITEATFRSDVGQKLNEQKDDGLSHKPNQIKQSMVEQQILKFQECEKLLYDSLSKPKNTKSKNVKSLSERTALIKPTPIISSLSKKNDPVKVKPKYVVEVDVGKFNGNNYNTKTNRFNIGTQQVSNISKYNYNNYKNKYKNILRKNVISSSLSLADPSLYNTKINKNLLLNPYIHNTSNKSGIFKSNSIKPTYTNNQSIPSQQRSKTPTIQKSTYNPSIYPIPNKYHTPNPLNPRETSVSLEFPNKPSQKKRFVTSVYLNSDADNNDINNSKNTRNSEGSSFDPPAMEVYNSRMYRSTFTLNF